MDDATTATYPTGPTKASDARARPRILVLGGGFAGLEFCKAFDSDLADVLLLDSENHHLFQPLLYQVATASLGAPDVAQPLRAILRKRQRVEVLMHRATGIDLFKRVVTCGDTTFTYDYLVLAVGGKTLYFGNDHWAQHAPGLKSLNDAQRIRNNLLDSLERAEAGVSDAERRRLLTAVVVGGGATGVEMAGTFADLYYRAFPRDYRRIDTRQARVILVDAAPRVLPGYSERLSESGKRQLEELGVEVRTGEMVKDVQGGKVITDKETIEAANIVWGAGIEANPLTKTLGIELAKAGRVPVAPDCSIPGHREAFAVGDLAYLEDANGRLVPGVAPAALQMARHVAKVIEADLNGTREAMPFAYFDKGAMATIGRAKAVAYVGKAEFGGLLAWLAWLFVHLVFLVGFRNKVTVLLSWFFAYVGFNPGARVLWGWPANRPVTVETEGERATDEKGAMLPGR